MKKNKILIINCGSSSLKFQFMEINTEQVLAKGICEKIGRDGSCFIYQKEGMEQEKYDISIGDHKQAVYSVINKLMEPDCGVIEKISDIEVIGHRLVHGGEKFSASVVITEEVLEVMEECIPLAPLHNPANLEGVRICQELMPGVLMIGVFDTAFHQTMPEKAYLYGIPYKFYEELHVRRYGFHGTSHHYVSKKTAEFLNQPLETMKIIVCHLGNGASVTAVKYGVSVDTSMGFSPLEGLIMGTRSGDIDPAVIEYLMNHQHMDIGQVMMMLNKESGVLGISGGLSSDFRDLAQAVLEGNQAAIRARDAFVYRVIKYIGAYVAAMDGVDAIVFTAGLGENGALVRSQICRNLSYLGVRLDEEKNLHPDGETLISEADLNSKVRVLVIPTNEELAICQEAALLLEHNSIFS